MPHPENSNWTNPWAVARFALTGAVGITADLLVKHWADTRLSTPDDFGRMPSITVIPGWLELEWTPNHGAALGFFQGYRWLFLIVSVLAIGFLGWLFQTSRRDQRGYQIVLGMLLAGVLGNMVDRVWLGYVRDMIHLWPGRRFPPFIAQHLLPFWSTTEWFPWIFNIADSLLCVGVALMLLHSLFYGGPNEPAAPAPGNSDENR
jgi:signal peptidase II